MAHGGCEAGRGDAALQYVRVLASPARGLPHWLTLQGNKAGRKRDPRMGRWGKCLPVVDGRIEKNQRNSLRKSS